MSAGCAGAGSVSGPADPVARQPAEPHWEPLFSPPPDVFILVRPQAVLSDAAFGPVVRGALALARDKSHLVASVGPAEVLEGAEEVLVAARDRGDPAEVDVVVVVRGVPADVDPARLADEAGHRLWVVGPSRPSPDVTELWRAPDSAGDGTATTEDTQASLFELPGRTWVLAAGASRARARELLSREASTARAVEGEDENALALVRVRGPSLVRRVRALRPPALLSPVGHALDALTLSLARGDGSIRATLSYADRGSVAPAESTVKEALRALTDSDGDKSGDGAERGDGGGSTKAPVSAWLEGSTVSSSACCVLVTVPARRR
jgi:hypothetical protein